MHNLPQLVHNQLIVSLNFHYQYNNRDNFHENKNINTNKNIDLLGGLLEVGGNENNNDNKKIDDVNDLFNGLNFNNENKVIKLNNMINNLNNNNINLVNQKDENDFNFGFDFSTFNKNIIHKLIYKIKIKKK